MKTKYIRWGVNILIFPAYMSHADVARPYTSQGVKIDGAGFLEFNTFAGTVMCVGESVSLGIGVHHLDVLMVAATLEMESRK